MKEALTLSPVPMAFIQYVYFTPILDYFFLQQETSYFAPFSISRSLLYVSLPVIPLAAHVSSLLPMIIAS